MSARGGILAPSKVLPEVTVNSPWGVRNRTTAPGIRSSLAVVSTTVCSAARSICLSPGELAVEPGTGVALVPDDVVGVDAVCVDGLGFVEHAAVRRATAIRKLATWTCPRRRRDRDRPRNVPTSFLIALELYAINTHCTPPPPSGLMQIAFMLTTPSLESMNAGRPTQRE